MNMARRIAGRSIRCPDGLTVAREYHRLGRYSSKLFKFSLWKYRFIISASVSLLFARNSKCALVVTLSEKKVPFSMAIGNRELMHWFIPSTGALEQEE